MERQLPQDNRSASKFKAFFSRYLGFLVRPETRKTFLAALVVLLSSVARKNGWTLSEEAGVSGPWKLQRLYRTARGDWAQMRRESLRHARELLWDEGGILVVDETGFIKSGDDSAGVQRQYTGTAGKRENCQIGVFVSYQSVHGRSIVDQRLYMPRSWMLDPERCGKAHVPDEVEFQTKPALAADMLDEVRAHELSAEWLTGDEVYGGHPEFRERQISSGQKFVLAIKSTERMWVRRPRMVAKRFRTGRIKRVPEAQGPRLRTAKETVAAFASRRWRRLKVSEGSKGPRVYDWAAKQVVHCEAGELPGHTFWLLARRSVSKPHEIAYYLCHAPAKTQLIELARVASQRWSVEECIKDGKQEVGLDDYQLRTYPGWHRWMLLCTLALLWLLCLKNTAKRQARARHEREPQDAHVEDLDMTVFAGLHVQDLPCQVTWSTSEVRRLFLLSLGMPALTEAFRLWWVAFRVRHNLKARRSHYKRRSLRFPAGFP